MVAEVEAEVEEAAMVAGAGSLEELELREEENPNYQRSSVFASSSSCGKGNSRNL